MRKMNTNPPVARVWKITTTAWKKTIRAHNTVFS